MEYVNNLVIFPEQDIKRWYLQKKLCVTIRDFIKALVVITWYSWIILRQCEENYFASIFKWLYHSIIYYNQEAKKSFLHCKGHWGSWKSWRSSVIGSSLCSSVIVFSLGFSMFRSFLDFSVFFFFFYSLFKVDMQNYVIVTWLVTTY